MTFKRFHSYFIDTESTIATSKNNKEVDFVALTVNSKDASVA